MNKELEKELLEYQNLPRRERRKKERELQNKHHDKSIRIKSGKTFKKGECLSRKQRREVLKDKNLLKELLKIIKKYFPELTNMFSNLTDKRNKSYITYKMRTIIMTRLFSLLCGITTMTGINNEFNTEEAIKNLSTICNQELDEIPNWQTIQDTIEQLDYQEIDDIRKYMFKALLRSKMFDRYKYNGCIQLIVDATGLTSFDYNLNGNCLTRTKDGKTKYYKYDLSYFFTNPGKPSYSKLKKELDYVAVSRPRHLLCLAIQKSELGEDIKSELQEIGWVIDEID